MPWERFVYIPSFKMRHFCSIPNNGMPWECLTCLLCMGIPFVGIEGHFCSIPDNRNPWDCFYPQCVFFFILYLGFIAFPHDEILPGMSMAHGDGHPETNAQTRRGWYIVSGVEILLVVLISFFFAFFSKQRG